jgi:hypothetical protein
MGKLDKLGKVSGHNCLVGGDDTFTRSKCVSDVGMSWLKASHTL